MRYETFTELLGERRGADLSDARDDVLPPADLFARCSRLPQVLRELQLSGSPPAVEARIHAACARLNLGVERISEDDGGLYAVRSGRHMLGVLVGAPGSGSAAWGFRLFADVELLACP